jgi:hypothetical protein
MASVKSTTTSGVSVAATTTTTATAAAAANSSATQEPLDEQRSLLHTLVEVHGKHKDSRTSRVFLLGELAPDVKAPAVLHAHESLITKFQNELEQEAELRATVTKQYSEYVNGADETSADGNSAEKVEEAADSGNSDDNDAATASDSNNQAHTPHITGLLALINDKVTVHVIEAPTKTIMRILRVLQKQYLCTEPTIADKNRMNALKLMQMAAKDDISVDSTGNSETKGQAEDTSAATDYYGLALPCDEVGIQDNDGTKSDPLFVNISVASFNEEVVREFPIWTCRPVAIPSEVDDEEAEVKIDNLLLYTFGMYRELLELGRESAANNGRQKEYLRNNKPQILQRFPSPERVTAVIKEEDVFSLKDYLEVYDAPINVTLASETVWPAESFVV